MPIGVAINGKTRTFSEIVVYLHSQLQRFFANVSINFSNSNSMWTTFAHVAILFSLMQRVEEYLVALKDFDYSCSLGYKRPIMHQSFVSPAPWGPRNSGAFNFSISIALLKALHCGTTFVVKAMRKAPAPRG